jgi:hypothetical protein
MTRAIEGKKMRIRALLLLSLLIVSGTIYAEGGSCPAGYYPIGGGGASGCAPLPDYAGNSETDQQIISQVNWKKTWGAIAVDNTLGKVGAAVGVMTKMEAEKSAIENCYARGGGTGCSHISMTYNNQCAAMAWGIDKYATASAKTIELASDSAMKECTKSTNDCKIYYSACSDPVPVQ